jgi:hypothetical protein
MGSLGQSVHAMGDRLSATYLVALASRAIREIGTLVTRAAAVVVWSFPGRQLVIDAENLDHSLVPLSLARAAGQSVAQVWLSSWTLPAQEVQGLATRLRQALDRGLSQREGPDNG